MNIEFWNKKWLENQTGFHLDRVNPYLEKHWSALETAVGATVFVPLCGKSLDIIWLANQGYQVMGVECSELAIHQFMSENKINYKEEIYRNFKVFSSNNIHLLQGDYFLLDKKLMEDVMVVYDRASLVAMPADKRHQYVDLQLSMLPENSKILLITVEYDQSLMNGPPFAVTQQEVMELYQGVFDIRLLSRNSILEDEPRFKQRGLDYLIESVYLLNHK